METLPCPGCKTELESDVNFCPICTRPRNKREITEAYEKLHAAQARRRMLPLKIVFYLLILGGGGWLFNEYRDAIIAKILSFKDFATLRMDEASDPQHLMKDKGAAPAGGEVAPPTNGTPVPEPPPASPLPAPAPTSSAATPPAVTALPLPSIDPHFQWVLRGNAINLLTLRPCPHAHLLLRVATAESAGAAHPVVAVTTDGYGRFAAALVRLYEGNYHLVANDPAYATEAFYEAAVPYADLTPENRRDMVRDALAGEENQTPLIDISGQSAVTRDVYLAPRS